MDLYGVRQLDQSRKRYAVSIKRCASPIRSFGGSLFPLPLNLIYPTPGNCICYAKKEKFGLLGQGTRWSLMQKIEPVGCHFGMMVAQSSRYYRAGYALTHPAALPGFLRHELRALSKSGTADRSMRSHGSAAR